MISAVAVVVPVHDEERLLDACLASVVVAAAACPVPTEVWVVLDACTDGSAAVARRHDVHVVQVRHRSVGRARAEGVAAALDRFAAAPRESLWTAHTDGDTIVPPDWLIVQRRRADAGAEAVVGGVLPSFGDSARTAAWQALHGGEDADPGVHGANLGIRADVLLAAGGFEPIAVHEDVRLIGRLKAGGRAVVTSPALRVVTSGRLVGRAPDGFARYLRDDLLLAAKA